MLRPVGTSSHGQPHCVREEPFRAHPYAQRSMRGLSLHVPTGRVGGKRSLLLRTLSLCTVTRCLSRHSRVGTQSWARPPLNPPRQTHRATPVYACCARRHAVMCHTVPTHLLCSPFHMIPSTTHLLCAALVAQRTLVASFPIQLTDPSIHAQVRPRACCTRPPAAALVVLVRRPPAALVVLVPWNPPPLHP